MRRLTGDGALPEVVVAPDPVVRDELVEEALLVGPADGRGVVVEGRAQEDAVDGHVGVGRDVDLVEHEPQELADGVEGLLRADAVHVLDAELVQKGDEDPLALRVLEPLAELTLLLLVQLRAVPAQQNQPIQLYLHLRHEIAAVGGVGHWGQRSRCMGAPDDPLVGELDHSLLLQSRVTGRSYVEIW